MSTSRRFFIKINRLLFLLLVFSFALRIFRLAYPASYVFDEVYHVPTARAYAENRPIEINSQYDWLHPPLAKLIQAASIKLLGDNSFAWRFPSAIFGSLAILSLYYLVLVLFKNQALALLAAFLFSFDGLELTMSRITMNDIFVTTWIILALSFFYQGRLFYTGIFTGLALATKWSGLLLYPILLIFLILNRKKLIKSLSQLLFTFYSLVVVPVFLYLLAYLPFFLHGNSLTDFFQLQQQIIWYQISLSATHAYQSSAWQWPLLIRPVWFYVSYSQALASNIYNLGNPAIFWGGLLALFYLLLKKFFSSSAVRYLLISYFLLWLPWLFSPRIMFLHHYLPALPFLCVILAKVLVDLKNKFLLRSYLLVVSLIFLFYYPLNTGLALPTNLLKYWFWLPSWR